MTTMDTVGTGRRPSLEELVDRLIDALLREEPAAEARSVAMSVHDARRMRQAGDLDGALAAFDGLDLGNASEGEAQWAYSEWLGIARRRFGGGSVLLYRQGTGRAAALVPQVDGALEAVAVLSLRWRPGKVVSPRSLRGLKPLKGGG